MASHASSCIHSTGLYLGASSSPRKYRMHVDQQTLRDLEIFEGRDGRPSLFNYLDRARTAGGSHKLRARLRYPLSQPREITRVQDSLRSIADQRDRFRVLPGQYLISGFENYFHWRLTPPAAGRGATLLIEGLQMWIGDYRQYAQITTGVRQTVHLLRALHRVAQDVTPAGVLTDYLGKVSAHLEELELASLPVKKPEEWHWWQVLRADQIFRKDHREAVKSLVDILFEIDALLALSDATIDNDFVLPEIGPPSELHATGLRYPLLHDPVINVLELTPPHRLLFITGPNMAGKTTYLRATGVALYLAHIGMGVPAQSFAFYPCDSFFTALTLLDDVRAGVSFFQAEAMRARDVAAAVAAGERVIALIDEPFKGTNVRDAFEASHQFLSRLANCEGSLFIVSSHLVEVGGKLCDEGMTSCCYFEANEKEGSLQFDYVMRTGISSQRLGMHVLKEHDVFHLLDSHLGRNGSG